MTPEGDVTEIDKANLVSALAWGDLHDIARRLCAEHDAMKNLVEKAEAMYAELKAARNAALGALNDAVDEIRRLQARVEMEELARSVDPHRPERWPHPNLHPDECECDRCEIDLDLLAKLARGEGGRRTGALLRAGLLEWKVTPEGLAALEKARLDGGHQEP